MNENYLKPLILGALAANCYILPLEDSAQPAPEDAPRPCAVIDPGGQPPVILERMKQLNLYPQYILLTHGHFDHTAALPHLAEAFPLAAVAIHPGDAAYLGKTAYALHRESFAAAGASSYVDLLWKDMPAPSLLLEDEGRAGPFTVLHLPGHTPGSAGFYLADHKILFTGDTLFRNGYGRTDLPGGDSERLRQSLERLFTLDGAVRVFPGHGPATTIGEEARRYR
ncbi:MAG: MBL fold metallo-hydrolase [Spirochaetaceae bacterium]|jgi:glyoxylase-like metal-dependent hydrolase (beta-lactamase superfamily II)|nr:MBL fold metallo-hydrolase [Spirochaetaceae bacterium]